MGAANASRSARPFPLATDTWGAEEPLAIQEVVRSGRYTMGPRVRELERAFADAVGSRHAVMVNSGSSANLLAVAALLYRKRGALAPGDQVIVPAVSWGTTYFPVHQHGLELRFVDVDPDSFDIDPRRVEQAITPLTRAILAVNLLGAPCDFGALERLCRVHGLVLLEDNCESLGAEYEGRQAGTFGLCGTFSTFFSHHISTMEGGFVVTDDEEIQHILLSLRAHGWTRELPPQNHVHPKSDDPFEDLFRFVLPGYNLRPTEISAAIGLCQLRKLPGFLAARRANARAYTELFGTLPIVSIQRPQGLSSWFGFPFVLCGALAGRRAEVLARLRDEGFETRPIVAGNFTKNPVIRHLRHSIAGPLTNAERLDADGFLVGNHHYDVAADLQRLRDVLLEVPG
jgi:CDP-6-deoxy-D-xylo-4-hexulose-3-dehydrase